LSTDDNSFLFYIQNISYPDQWNTCVNLIEHLMSYKDIFGEGIKAVYIYINFNNLWIEHLSSKQEFTKAYEEYEIIVYEHRQKRNKLKERRRYVLGI